MQEFAVIALENKRPYTYTFESFETATSFMEGLRAGGIPPGDITIYKRM